MNCVVLRSEKKDAWAGRRSVEVIGYHRDRQEIHILIVLYLENKLPSLDNYIYVLHPGNVEFKVVRPWPPPWHPDEPRSQPCNILESVYKDAFDDSGGKLYQVNGLASWDSWYGCSRERITIWPDEQHLDYNNCITQSFGLSDKRDFAPFTELRLGPFTQKGANLISLELLLKGATYARLLDQSPVFIIDGPESLLLRIERDHIRPMSLSEQGKWSNRLDLFGDYIGCGESYDVILIKHPFATAVTRIWRDYITRAPIQPPEQIAERYITRNSRFCLGLRYSSGVFIKPQDVKSEAVIKKANE